MDGVDASLIRDRYEPREVLGRGGQGEVLKSLDHQHGRWVALKIRPVPDPDQRQALLAEARILLSLRPHPNLPLVREDFFWEDRYVLVMDWVEGTDLGQVLVETGDPGLQVSSVVGWLTQAGDALGHLHAQGVVHGDVKPSNLVLTPDGRLVLVDFGISRGPGETGYRPLGSPGYAAPELSLGDVTPAADIYGLAATAVALFTGAPPTGGRPDWVGVPNAGAIERALRRGLAIDPTRRPRGATELIERLRANLSVDLPAGVVTFLLTDIEGSTARWEDDPEGMADDMVAHDSSIAEAVESHGGRLLKTRGEGDATFSVFVRASDAAAASLAAQRILIEDVGMPVRMAIHTGEAEVRDGDYFGRTVNRASRLRAIARGGQVLLSGAAAELVLDALPAGASLADLGFHELRDLARGEQVFALLHPDLPSPDEMPVITSRRGGPTPTPAQQVTPQVTPPVVPAAAPEPSTQTPPPVAVPADPGARIDPLTLPPARIEADTIAPSVAPPSPSVSPAAPVVAASQSVVAPAAPGQAPGGPLPPGLAAARATSFVGRSAELDRLLQAWSRAKRGERRLVLVGGEPGIGKTQLATELAAIAHGEGATVLHGRCDEGLQVPYQPFAAALGQVLDRAAAANAVPSLGRLASELVRLSPEIAERVPGLAAPLRADPETEQYRLFDAVAAWLHAAAQQAPLVLVLDDLHWATRPTLHLLRHVVRMTEPARLLVVGTYRDTELERGHPLSELLADLHRVPSVERLALRGLANDEIASFLDANTGQQLGEAGVHLAAAIQDETNGNPFFLRQLFRHLIETGILSQGTGDRWIVHPYAEPLGVPEGVREVVGRRLARLSEGSGQVLEVAAVIGPEFDLPLVVKAGALDEDEALAALDEAVGARLVDEVGAGRFRFAHAIVRSTLYDGLARARRSRAHRRVAEAIEELHANDLDSHLTELASHYAEAATAGDGTKAVEYATRAGDIASGRLAYDEAVTCYRMATDLLVTTEAPVDEQTRCRLLISLGEAEYRAGEPRARATLLDAAGVAQRWRDRELLGAAALALGRTAVTLAPSVDAERIAVLEAALELWSEGDSPERARLLAHLAIELVGTDDWQRRSQLSDEAIEMSRRSGDDATLAQVLVLRSQTIWHASTLTERRAIADEQLALAERLHDPALEVAALVNGVTAGVEAGDLDVVRDRLARARTLAEELGQPALRWQVTLQDARLACMFGQFEEAEALISRALELGQAASQPDAEVAYVSQFTMLRSYQGRIREVAPLLEAAARLYPKLPGFQAAYAQALFELGRADEARLVFERLWADGFDRLHHDHAWSIHASVYANIAARLRYADAATELFDQLLPYRHQFIADRETAGGSVGFLLGLLAGSLERYDEAETFYTESLDTLQRLGLRLYVALNQVDFAAMLRRRGGTGDVTRARNLLSAARSTATEFGQVDLAARADTLIASVVPPQLPDRLAAARTGALVGRESELETLEAAWERARGGTPSAVMLAGDLGTGKTRLVAELAARVRTSGAIVLAGGCDDGPGVPFQPFVEALEQSVVAAADADLPSVLGNLAPELVRLVPEIADRLPAIGEPMRSDPETERYRLFDAVGSWLRAMSERAPVLLVLDDLQWAARPTVQLLRHVSRLTAPARVLIVGCFRDTELDRGHPLSDLLADLHRTEIERLTLSGINADQVGQLLEAAAGIPLDDFGRQLAESLYHSTEGNPFFVREVIRHLWDTGTVAQLDGRWSSFEGLDQAGVPESIRGVVARRLASLTADANQALGFAAVIGDEADLALLAAVVDLDEDSLLAALDEASAAGLVREEPAVRPRYRFAHPLVRETVYDDLTAGRRTAAHRRVGEAIERLHAGHLDEHLTALAHHFLNAGADPFRAAAYSLRAGDRALEKLANDDAVAHYRRGIEVLGDVGGDGDDGKLCAELLVSLGEALRRASDASYRAVLFDAAQAAEVAGSTELLVRAALANFRSSFSAVGSVDHERIALLERALEAAGPDDSTDRARLLGHLAVELTFGAPLARRDELSAESEAIARRVGDPTTLAQVLGCRSEAISHASTIAERKRIHIEQVEIATRLGDPNVASLATLQRCYDALADLDIAQFDALLADAAQMVGEINQPLLRWSVATTLASRAFFGGRFDEADRLIVDAFQLGQEAGQPDAFVVFVGQVALLRYFQGRLNELEGTLTAAVPLVESLPSLLAAISTMEAELGHFSAARHHFEQLAADDFASIPDDLVWLTGVSLSAQTCHLLGDAARAEVLIRLLEPYAGTIIAEGPNFLGAVDRYLGILAATARRWDDAARWLEQAATLHRTVDAAGFSALGDLDLAKVLAERGQVGDRERSGQLAIAAVDASRALGMATVTAQAEILIDQLARPPLPAALQGPPRTFVGRGPELETLRELWHKAQSGTRQLGLVGGEPGIGKTTLVSIAAIEAYGDGALVLFGRCDEDSVVPLQPFVEVVRAALSVGALTPERLAPEVARLLPELDVPAGQTNDSIAGVERHHLFDAISAALDAVAAERPMVLVVDDLHWADQPTLALLRQLVRRPVRTSLLVLGTYRDTEVARTHPLAEFLAGVRRERLSERLVLRGLSTDEVIAFVEHRAGYELDEGSQSFAISLREIAEGNPFFIDEILRHLAESGALVERDGTWTLTTTAWDELGIPEGVRDVIGRRLSRLSPTANQVLAAGSVLGRSFSFDVLAQMVEDTEEAVLSAVEEALGVRLLVEQRDGADTTLVFRHALVRETLYDELSLPRRQRLHLRAAQAIEATLPPDHLNEYAGSLASHYRAAGVAADPEKVVTWSTLAGIAAARVFAYEEAGSHLEGAVVILGEHRGVEHDLSRAALLDQLCKLRFLTSSDRAAGVPYGEEAVELYERHGERYKAAKVHSLLGTYYSTVGSIDIDADVHAALAHFEAARPVLSEGDDLAAGYFYTGLATAYLRALELDQVQDAAERARAIALERDQPSLLGIADLMVAMVLWERGELDAARTLLEQAHAVAERIDHVALTEFTVWNGGEHLSVLDDLDGAVEWFQRGLDSPRLANAPRAMRLLAGRIARWEFERGDVAAADDDGSRTWPAAILSRMGDGAGDEVSRVVSDVRRAGDRWGLLWLLPPAADVLRQLGRMDEAEKLLDEAFVLAAGAGAVPLEVRARLSAVHLAVASGDAGRARGNLDRARSLVGPDTGWAPMAARLAHAEAVTLAAEGDLIAAEAAFEVALVGVRDARRAWTEAEVLADLSRARRAGADETGALAARDEAAAVYNQIGAPAHWLERLP